MSDLLIRDEICSYDYGTHVCTGESLPDTKYCAWHQPPKLLPCTYQGCDGQTAHWSELCRAHGGDTCGYIGCSAAPAAGVAFCVTHARKLAALTKPKPAKENVPTIFEELSAPLKQRACGWVLADRSACKNQPRAEYRIFCATHAEASALGAAYVGGIVGPNGSSSSCLWTASGDPNDGPRCALPLATGYANYCDEHGHGKRGLTCSGNAQASPKDVECTLGITLTQAELAKAAYRWLVSVPPTTVANIPEVITTVLAVKRDAIIRFAIETRLNNMGASGITITEKP